MWLPIPWTECLTAAAVCCVLAHPMNWSVYVFGFGLACLLAAAVFHLVRGY